MRVLSKVRWHRGLFIRPYVLGTFSFMAYKRKDDIMSSMIKRGRHFDYVRRVLASFAEIYNYDYVLESFLEESTKIFWESLEDNKHFYCYQIKNNKAMLDLADMIGMAVRIVEAFGVHEYEVHLSSNIRDQKELFRYLDCLDINYETLEMMQEKLFEIFILDEAHKKQRILWGGEQNDAYCCQGYYEDIVGYCEETLKLEEKSLDIVVMSETDFEQEHALYLVQELRLNGFKTEMIGEKSLDLIKEICPTKYVIFLNDEDIQNDEVCLIDFYTKEKEQIKEMDLISHLDINF